MRPTGPNIVFILADDMRWDMMGCARQPHHPDPAPRCTGQGRHAFQERLRHHVDLRREPRLDPHGTLRADAPIHLRHEADHRRSTWRSLIPCCYARPAIAPASWGSSGSVCRRGHRSRCSIRSCPSTARRTGRSKPDGTLKHLTDLEGEAAIDFIEAAQAGRAVLPVGQLQCSPRRGQRPEAVLLAEGGRSISIATRRSPCRRR